MVEVMLEQRIARLESRNAICDLMHEYLIVADNGYDPDAVVKMFVSDGTWTGDGFGTHNGTDEIHALFKRFSGVLVFAAHFVTNPIIAFHDDRNARGRWRLMEAATANENGSLDSKLMVAAYDNEFTQEAGVWKFRSVRVHVNFFEPITKGWAHAAKS